jgi:hypothetical protein
MERAKFQKKPRKITSKPAGWKRTLPVRIDTGGRLRQQRVRTKTTRGDDACTRVPGFVIQYELMHRMLRKHRMTNPAFGGDAGTCVVVTAAA